VKPAFWPRLMQSTDRVWSTTQNWIICAPAHATGTDLNRP
jgi:hypothetical protein